MKVGEIIERLRTEADLSERGMDFYDEGEKELREDTEVDVALRREAADALERYRNALACLVRTSSRSLNPTLATQSEWEAAEREVAALLADSRQSDSERAK